MNNRKEGMNMKQLVKTILCVALVLCFCIGMAGCKTKNAEAPALTDCGIIHEPEFGGVYITATIDEFNALGFQYGDSVDVVFSNGCKLSDLPYYNGYYTQTGEPLLIAYPGYDYIKAAINNGDDLWTVAGLSEKDTATVTLRAHAEYQDIQSARDIHYEDIREKFPSDAVFANFRAIRVKGMKENMVYRSASPCDNQHNRAPYADTLIKDAGVAFIVNLSDNESKISGYLAKEDFNSPYFLSLYEAGKVIPLALNMNFGSDEFKGKVVKGLAAMAENDGPYLIHCTEGKDRTGFVCMLLEALVGADYEEIVRDYMITYDNYYQITKDGDPSRYNIIVENVLDPMIRTVVGDAKDLTAADYAACAEQYLLNAGMTAEQIAVLRSKIAD